MKKMVGFMSGVAAVALMGTGVYMMMSKDSKKHMKETVNSTLEDANRMITKKMNSINN